MAVSRTYDNVQWPGGDGLRVPQERAGFVDKPTQTLPTLETYGEVDLGVVATSPYTLNAQQAGASLITVNPSVALTLIFPVCQPGHRLCIQNLSGANVITAQAGTNAANVATVAISSIAEVVMTGTNLGIALVSGT